MCAFIFTVMFGSAVLRGKRSPAVRQQRIVFSRQADAFIEEREWERP
jgi:hypothetical protein